MRLCCCDEWDQILRTDKGIGGGEGSKTSSRNSTARFARTAGSVIISLSSMPCGAELAGTLLETAGWDEIEAVLQHLWFAGILPHSPAIVLQHAISAFVISCFGRHANTGTPAQSTSNTNAQIDRHFVTSQMLHRS
jgi:hypothetical protein